MLRPTSFRTTTLARAAALSMIAGLALASPALAGGGPDVPDSGITYQGQLVQNGSPVDGQRDMRFRLFNVETGGAPIQTVQAFGVDVSDGLFSVDVDFGAAAWASNDQFWIEIEAGPADMSQSYELIGRQKLAATPFSINTRGLSVNADGSVGIGTEATGRPLTVRGPSSWMLGLEGPTNPGLRIASDNSNALGTSWAIFQESSTGDLQFRDSFNALNRLTIDSSNGRVGIGDATPDATLDVNGSGTFSGNVGIGTDLPQEALQVGSFADDDRFIQVSTAGGNRFQAGIKFTHFASDNGFEILSEEDPANDNKGLKINDLSGATTDTRFFIEEGSGDVGIGTTNPLAKLHVSGRGFFSLPTGIGALPSSDASLALGTFSDVDNVLTIRDFTTPFDVIMNITNEGRIDGFASNNTRAFILGRDSNATFANSGYLLLHDNNGAIRSSIRMQDFPGLGQFSVVNADFLTENSDRRLKKDIATISGALDTTLALRGASYRMADQDGGPTTIGFIAQEVEEVVPTIVHTDEDGMKSVAYSKVTALLVEATRELKAEKDTEIAELRAEIEAMKSSMQSTTRPVSSASLAMPLLGLCAVGGVIAYARRRNIA